MSNLISQEFLQVSNLITFDENQYFDRKSSSIKISKLVETIIAFANANGGIIAIGIDDGVVTGINNQGNIKVNDFIQCGFDLVVPSVNITHIFIDVINNSGKDDRILLLSIEQSVDKVHKTKSDDVYLRVGDESKKLTFEQRLSLQYAKGERSFEDNIIDTFDIEDEVEELDQEILSKYGKALGFTGKEYHKLLLARGFARRINNNIKLTNAGVLLFYKNPTLFLPASRIRFIRYDGIKAEVGTSMNIIKDVLIEGTLATQIEKTKSIVKSQLRDFSTLDPQSGKFITIPEYPEFAWLEGVVNAVTHRAYNLQGDDIKIIMFDDRLEIISPGRFPNIVNKSNIKETRYSRNPRIARALTEMGWVRELGEGVNRIYKEMKSYFLEEPIYDEQANTVTLILKNNIVMRRERRNDKVNLTINFSWEELSNHEKSALEYLYNKDKITSKELSELINKSSTYSRKILRNLEEKNIITRVSTSKNDPMQYFILNIQNN